MCKIIKGIVLSFATTGSLPLVVPVVYATPDISQALPGKSFSQEVLESTEPPVIYGAEVEIQFSGPADSLGPEGCTATDVEDVEDCAELAMILEKQRLRF